ncbi:MAG TPA: NAD(P)H-binding protein [Solirubrobacteraceae bacterium]|jgi:uncharacterized protein YbjT (DUF2867 family)|nr:NAD(P)H-binding protein [Solirubrobacteraceae bacterium]
MTILVTGITGYVGSVLAARLVRDGHAVRGFARSPDRVALDVPVVAGDAVSGQGLREALDGIDVAYFLIHGMEPANGGPFALREREAADRFAVAAVAAGVSRIVYLGGIAPPDGVHSAHLASRLAVEDVLLDAVPDSVALRASIVIGARSRSFRFLVRLVERMPVLAYPAWQSNRTAPIDERDIVAMLARAATSDRVTGRRLDVGGPDVVSYGDLIGRIADLMLVGRPALRFKKLSATPIASRVSAAIAGEQWQLVGPLMESLGTDLVPADGEAARLLEVRLHPLDAAIEHALAEWERQEPLRAR